MARSLTAMIRTSLLLAMMCTLPCLAIAVEEVDLKAAIVYNILLFVTWPAEASASAPGTLRFCIAAANPLSPAMKTLNGRDVGGLKLDVTDFDTANPAKPCHAVFVDAADRIKSAGPLLEQRTHGALVLSDDPDAPVDVTAILLRRNGSRLSFEINLQPARQAGVRLSSKLLRLAKTVRE